MFLVFLILGVFDTIGQTYEVDTVVINTVYNKELTEIKYEQLVFLNENHISMGYAFLNRGKVITIDSRHKKIYCEYKTFVYKYIQYKKTNYDYDMNNRKNEIGVRIRIQ